MTLTQELVLQKAMVRALYDSLTWDLEDPMDFGEFYKEYHEYGLFVAVFNLGFLAGGK